MDVECMELVVVGPGAIAEMLYPCAVAIDLRRRQVNIGRQDSNRAFFYVELVQFSYVR